MSSVLHLPPASSVTAAVEELRIAVGSVALLVAAGRLGRLSDPELLAVTADIHALSSQLDAIAVSTVAEVRDGEVARSEGFASTSSWLEARAGLSSRQSRSSVALGEKLQWEFEATREAWLTGEIRAGAVQAITTLIPRRLKGLPESDYVAARTELEAMALHHARTRTVAQVRRAIERAAIVADPVGAEAAVLAARQSEFLAFAPVADGVEVRGFLSSETAAVVLTAFDQCHDALVRNGQLAGDQTDDHRRAAPTARLRRARRERSNAQILGDLVTRLLDDGALGSKNSQRPHLTVTVHADDYAAGLGGDILLPGFGRVPVPTTTIDRLLCDSEVHPVLTRRRSASPARTTGPSPGATPGSSSASGDPTAGAMRFPGAVPRSTDPPWRPRLRPRPGGGWEHDITVGVDPTPEEMEEDTDVAALAELGGDLDDRISWWNRFLGEPARHVLDVGRSYRLAPPKVRQALTVRDGGCVVPGCSADPSRCEAHHITYWEHGGATSIANMVLLCARHHHMVHEGRWRIERDEELDPGDPGYIILVPPTRHP